MKIKDMLKLWESTNEQMGTPGWLQLYTDAPIHHGTEWPPVVKVGDKFTDKDGLIWKAVEVTPTGVNMELTTAPKAWGIRKFFITNKELVGFKKV